MTLGDVVRLDIDAHGAARALDGTANLGLKVEFNAHVERAAGGAAVAIPREAALADGAARPGIYIELHGKVHYAGRQRRCFGLGLAADFDYRVSLTLGGVAILRHA
jgi:hypothetical protein